MKDKNNSSEYTKDDIQTKQAVLPLLTCISSSFKPCTLFHYLIRYLIISADLPLSRMI